LTECLFTDKIN